MKKRYDFSKGKRGAVLPSAPHKTRITIRLDADVIAWFRDQVNRAGGGGVIKASSTRLCADISSTTRCCLKIPCGA